MFTFREILRAKLVVDDLITDLIKVLDLAEETHNEFINKPLETTNEQPEYCNCKLVNGACEAIDCAQIKGREYTGKCILG